MKQPELAGAFRKDQDEDLSVAELREPNQVAGRRDLAREKGSLPSFALRPRRKGIGVDFLPCAAHSICGHTLICWNRLAIACLWRR